jgi:hypothetical protein
LSDSWQDWAGKAKDELRVSRNNYNDGEFWRAIADLQLAEEMTAKVLLMRTQFLPQSVEVKSLMDDLGVADVSPSAYNHDWHKHFLKALKPFVDLMGNAAGSVSTSDPLKSAFDDLARLVPDYDSKLQGARGVPSIPIPTLAEIDAVIMKCREYIDASTKESFGVVISNADIPGAEVIDRIVRQEVARLSISLGPAERKSLEDRIRKQFPDSSWYGKVAGPVMQASVLLVAMAMLNVFLWKHHTMAVYPGKVIYDPNFPLVQRYDELASLVGEALNQGEQIKLP